MNVFRVVLFVVILVTAGLFALLIFYPHCAYAANITVTGSTWSVGPVGAGAEDSTSSNNWIITNTSTGIEDIDIRVSSTGNWSASDSGTSGSNEFGLKVGSSGGMIITDTDGTLTTDLLTTYDLGLWFKAPSDGSDEGPHTLTVTLSATNWRQATVIYMATATTNGALGGRSGADTFCAGNKPPYLPADCGNIHAFLGVNLEDEIREMPMNYGYISSWPLYFWNDTAQILTKFANNWPDMFDGSIMVLPKVGLGLASYSPWTGSMGDGGYWWCEGYDEDDYSCRQWSSGNTVYYGAKGANYTNTKWLYEPWGSCEEMRGLLCVCGPVSP